MVFEPPKPTTYNVLLIEQDPKQTELYSELINEVAACQIDVIARFTNSFDWVGRSNYNLIVIDIPFIRSSQEVGSEIDGVSILEKIKRLSPFTSVILISDQASVEEAVSSIKLGAEDYFKKPFNPESFRLAVKRSLDRKTVFLENAGAASYLNLINACQMISASLEQEKIFGIIQSFFSRELSSHHSALYTADNTQLIRLEDPSYYSKTDQALEEVLDIALHASNPLYKMIESGEYYRFIERGQLTPGLFVFRFKCVSKSDFFCVCLSPKQPSAIEEFEGRLKILKAQIELTGKNIEHYKGIQHLAYVDDVTGLYNTRYLNYILDREIAQSKSTQKSFAILFIDADKFKGVNDTHGHRIGTKLLNELGRHLKNYVREADTVFRYGGDEFVAVLSPCDLGTAQSVAERIRTSIEITSFLAHEGVHFKFTVSIGVALFPDHADSKKAIIDVADKAMYTAKKTTRNRVFIAGLENFSDENVLTLSAPKEEARARRKK